MTLQKILSSSIIINYKHMALSLKKSKKKPSPDAWERVAKGRREKLRLSSVNLIALLTTNE